jgi:hypothetical protein
MLGVGRLAALFDQPKDRLLGGWIVLCRPGFMGSSPWVEWKRNTPAAFYCGCVDAPDWRKSSEAQHRHRLNLLNAFDSWMFALEFSDSLVASHTIAVHHGDELRDRVPLRTLGPIVFILAAVPGRLNCVADRSRGHVDEIPSPASHQSDANRRKNTAIEFARARQRNFEQMTRLAESW